MKIYGMGALRQITMAEPNRMVAWKAVPVRFVQVTVRILLDLENRQLSLWAMSLVYTTLLALVPLLAVSFSVLKAFGVHNEIKPLLLNFLAPLGSQGVVISDHAIGFVANINASVLGSMGLGLLFLTVVSLTHKVERAFNTVWRVKRERPFAKRLTDFLGVIMVGPVFVFSALGISASLISSDAFQWLLSFELLGLLVGLASKLIPFFFILVPFVFLYVLTPNTEVDFGPAVVGAGVAGALWEVTGWAFSSFVVNSSNYTAIYSAFATLILFLIWLYLSWLILLVGASVAFYHQNSRHLAFSDAQMRPSSHLQELAAFQILALIGASHYAGDGAWTSKKLGQAICLPTGLVANVVEILLDGGYLARVEEPRAILIPARPLDATPLDEVLRLLRRAGEGPSFQTERLVLSPEVLRLSTVLGDAASQALAGRTWKDLAQDAASRASRKSAA